MEDKKDITGDYKTHTYAQEQSLETLISYFQERVQIEQTYTHSLEKLSKKMVTEPSSPWAKTSSRTFQYLSVFTQSIASEHSQIKDVLKYLINDLQSTYDEMRKDFHVLRAEVKKSDKQYEDLLYGSVLKVSFQVYSCSPKQVTTRKLSKSPKIWSKTAIFQKM